MDEIQVTICKRTPASGHLTAVMDLPGAVAFADAELAQGRAVILEMGEESWVIRRGREIVGFIKRALGKGKPSLTSIAPMAGGAMATGTDPTAFAPAPFPPVGVLRDRDYAGAVATGGMMEQSRGRAQRSAPDSDIRAWNALVEQIGERSALGMLTGGGYAVLSTLWPQSVIYVVTPETIKVINQGIEVSRICLVSTDGVSIWDVVLNRIQLLKAGIDGEVQVYATGQLSR